MKMKETECGKNFGVIDILQGENLNRESIKKIEEKKRIFRWQKKIIENVSVKMKEQYNKIIFIYANFFFLLK